MQVIEAGLHTKALKMKETRSGLGCEYVTVVIEPRFCICTDISLYKYVLL